MSAPALLTRRCPLCIAVDGLAALRALTAGQDASWGGATFKLRGRPLDSAAQAGVAAGILEQVTQAGALCSRHDVAYPLRARGSKGRGR